MRAILALFAALCLCTPALAATYSETFNDNAANSWTVAAGTWAAQGSVYRSSGIGGNDISIYGAVTWLGDYTFRAKINNAYNALANQAGVVYNYRNANNYYAVKFSPTGRAFLVKVIGGTETAVANANYAGGGSEVWFTVEVARAGTATTVKVNGVTVFNNVSQPELGPGKVGLITSFADASFNDVTVDSATPFSENFSDGVANSWVVGAGTWSVVNANTYRSTAIGGLDRSIYGAASWLSGFSYRARIYNAYSADGNLAGLIYNYVNANNYYAVKFAPTGRAFLVKMIGGTETPVANASYSGGGSGVWFDVEVLRAGTATTVKVNGVTVFNNVTQNELGAGRVGLITAFADARFDGIVLSMAPAGGDAQAPSVPSGLAGTAISSSQIDLTWNASTDNVAVTDYRVYVNNVLRATVPGATSYSHTGLTPQTTYSYQVSARDAAGNESARSAPVGVATPAGEGSVTYECDFSEGWDICGFTEQSKDELPRAAVISISRPEFPSFPHTAVRLRTKDGDTEVAGSESAVRNDLRLSDEDSDCQQGRVHWWAHSIRFPTGYGAPPGWYVVMDFHHFGNTGQANFHVDSDRGDGQIHFRVHGGEAGSAALKDKAVGPVIENIWYDFVYHVKWSSGDDGFFYAWIRKGDETSGRLLLEHTGPTLYEGQGCYLKLANYHERSAGDSIVDHARVIRGTSASAVSLTPLEPVP
jgi:hypothetical protein